jgi:recombinational DNA repair protein RecR
METEDLEIAYTVLQEEDAYILRGFLENEGIPCQLENLVFHAEPIPVAGLTKVRLWTKKSDVERARKLIQEREQSATCSACGHVVMTEDASCDFCGEPLQAK